MDGFLNLNKPANFTSHDCVAKLRKILNTRKIGHGGTLDPCATGVLPIAVGKATRLLQFLPTKKAYIATIRLGLVTTTDDLEGEVIKNAATVHVTLEEIQSCLRDFIGVIRQKPPVFSAIKKGGEKLYNLARKGIEVEAPVREVFIESIEILGWRQEEAELDLNIVCDSGTYIRSIARDLGEKLGCGGTLAGLKRTLSCGMIIENSLTLEEITEQKKQGILKLIEIDKPLDNLPAIYLKKQEGERWLKGQKLEMEIETEKSGKIFRTYNHQRQFIGISEMVKENPPVIKPKVVIG
ncbi:MAG: tRNA pseudouridine(55) synthase TruB [Geminocystis sp.]|nr:tRNA pseudouridine(55) synthase TruB [Geminocystis sp.]HIK38425.1 tRNA pseudouridine(55) synthase TruB [Geminocystis sp. M7585_C2015_104]MCS7147770.1 tRNA pseudouridine(55) synthase TruB [Geminocystis sp.]MCX8079210.1 tRNA pseudouridine(55) synthase TruB [Geminocystis sp.]MDW8116656.1 tRNA pseudouridine(55) synthase TruB [Geminocystis sp.]